MEYTVKQMAELLNVSKPTVQKAIRSLKIKSDRKDNINRAYYSYENTITILRTIKPTFNFAVLSNLVEKPRSQTAKPPTEPPTTANSTAKTQSETAKPQTYTAKPQNGAGAAGTDARNEEIQLLRDMLHTIQEQLREKDNQLAVKDRQIEELSNRLREAMELTKGQQYIAAADKTAELIEANSKTETENQQKEPLEAAVNVLPDEPKAAAAPKKEKKGFLRHFFRR